MFEADPVTMATLATDAAQTVLQVGPPADAAAQAPAFVQDILAEVGSSAGDAAGGLGETISGMTPGGSDVAAGASDAAEGAGEAAGAAGNAPGR
ncbi:hypothetical protein [Halorubrum kocurii]|uniref:Uncharacterized protein n=1 Tax=Halorubrum kocurii JCM 14978 TaxID=1230456 RepID=M0NZ58_9EURY|nr:hypothetical protein [Halorubrum kocurii]EMA61850.1 hypothetical protein C468_11640 [Halorubrum kocurii JCM 14978]